MSDLVSSAGPLRGNPTVIFNSCKRLLAEGRVYTQHSPRVSGEQGRNTQYRTFSSFGRREAHYLDIMV